MSELKARHIVDVYDYYYAENPFGERSQVYLKSEADKVIAELKAQKVQAEDDCAYWKSMAKKNAVDNSVMAKQRTEAVKKERHHKYKRCLDNAWGCQQRMELFHELVLEEARTIALPNEGALKEYRRKRERAAKWHKRWLKIAEQFKDKEAK